MGNVEQNSVFKKFSIIFESNNKLLMVYSCTHIAMWTSLMTKSKLILIIHMSKVTLISQLKGTLFSIQKISFFSYNRFHSNNGKKCCHDFCPANYTNLSFFVYQKSNWYIQLYVLHWTLTLHGMDRHWFICYAYPTIYVLFRNVNALIYRIH